MKAVAVAFALLLAPTQSPAAPDEVLLGRDEGYPVCNTGLGREQRCLVGLLSNYDKVSPARTVAKGAAPRELKRAPAELEGAERFMDANRNTGLLVLRGDTILAERYSYGRKPSDRFQSYSMAKTVVALLVGIALHERNIASLDDPAEKYVPALMGRPLGEASLRHLLTMSSGVAFREDYGGKDDSAELGLKTIGQKGPGGADSVANFNERARPAGEKFSYSSAESQVLGLVLRAATGRTLSEYLAEKIWQPMGAEADATWQMDAGGYETGYMGINATLRDWGRLGLLLADGGARDGRQIIPAGWVKEMTTVHAPHLAVGTATARNGYGYQTWIIDNQGRFALMGVRGQAVMVDPATRTVMVHTAVHGDPRDGAPRGPQFRLFFETLRRAGG